MKKYIRQIAAFAIFLSLFSIVSSVPVKAEEAIEVEARSALLMEASTGKIIYEKMLMKICTCFSNKDYDNVTCYGKSR